MEVPEGVMNMDKVVATLSMEAAMVTETKVAMEVTKAAHKVAVMAAVNKIATMVVMAAASAIMAVTLEDLQEAAVGEEAVSAGVEADIKVAASAVVVVAALVDAVAD